MDLKLRRVGALLAIVFNTAYGVMNARKTRVLAARIMGARRLHILLVVLLESLPQTFIGLRTGVSISLISVCAEASAVAKRGGNDAISRGGLHV